MRNVPPMTPDQNVYVLVRLKEKSNVRRCPVAPAMWSAAAGETGIFISSVITTAIIAATMSTICFTSTQVTACTPPIMVYRTAGVPMIATERTMLQPKMAEKTTAGAEMMVPQESAREMRKRNAVSER